MIRQNFVSGFIRTILILFTALSLIPLFRVGVLAGEPASIAAIPSRLIIPTIGLDSPVVPVIQKTQVINNKTYKTWQVSDNKVGWNDRSAPLGQAGNTVLTGHSDIKAKVFRNLKDVRLGDEIIVLGEAEGQVFRYVVTQKFLVQEKGVSMEVRLKNGRWIKPTQDERLTLITCAQPGATHRLIVIALPLRAAG